MLFSKKEIPQTVEYTYTVDRWVSENGVWEICLDKVMFGCRVHIIHEQWRGTYVTDLCSGGDPDWQRATMYVVLKYMEQKPEDGEIRPAMGRFPCIVNPKPIHRNEEAWKIMCDMAEVGTTDHIALSDLADKMGIGSFNFDAIDRLTLLETDNASDRDGR